jgi:hypothetical protein
MNKVVPLAEEKQQLVTIHCVMESLNRLILLNLLPSYAKNYLFTPLPFFCN